jgi:hypothetical protein
VILPPPAVAQPSVCQILIDHAGRRMAETRSAVRPNATSHKFHSRLKASKHMPEDSVRFAALFPRKQTDAFRPGAAVPPRSGSRPLTPSSRPRRHLRSGHRSSPRYRCGSRQKQTVKVQSHPPRPFWWRKLRPKSVTLTTALRPLTASRAT